MIQDAERIHQLRQAMRAAETEAETARAEWQRLKRIHAEACRVFWEYLDTGAEPTPLFDAAEETTPVPAICPNCNLPARRIVPGAGICDSCFDWQESHKENGCVKPVLEPMPAWAKPGQRVQLKDRWYGDTQQKVGTIKSVENESDNPVVFVHWDEEPRPDFVSVAHPDRLIPIVEVQVPVKGVTVPASVVKPKKIKKPKRNGSAAESSTAVCKTCNLLAIAGGPEGDGRCGDCVRLGVKIGERAPHAVNGGDTILCKCGADRTGPSAEAHDIGCPASERSTTDQRGQTVVRHPSQMSATALEAGAVEEVVTVPTCYKCGCTGGKVRELPSQAEELTDLIPCDMIDFKVLDNAGIPDQDTKNSHLCAGCHGNLVAPRDFRNVERRCLLSEFQGVTKRMVGIMAEQTALRTLGDVIDRAAALGESVPETLDRVKCLNKKAREVIAAACATAQEGAVTA